MDMAQALQRTQALVEAARLISASGHDLDAVLDTLTEQTRLLVGGDGGALHLAEWDGRLVVRRASSLAAPGAALATAGTRFWPGKLTREAIVRRRPVVAGRLPHQAELDPGTRRTFPTVGTCMAVPLIAGDELVGVMHVAWEQCREIAPEDLEIAEALGAHAAVAIRAARLVERLRAEALRISRSQKVNAALAHALTPEEVTAVVVQEGRAAMGASAGLVALLTPDRREVEIVMAAGYPEEAVTPWRRFPADAPVPLVDAMRWGEPIFIESAAEVIARYPALAAAQRITQTGALAALPLAVGEEVFGALGLSFEEDRAIAPEERRWMVSLAQRCALALDRARLFAEARRSDERYRLVAVAAAAAIWEWEAATNQVIWSGAGREAFGYPPDASPTTPSWWLERVHPEDRAGVWPNYRPRGPIAPGSTTSRTHEYRFRRADGSYVPCLAVTRTVWGADRQVVRALGMIMDISRLRRAEQERDRLAEALVRAEERQRMAMDLHDGVIQQLFGATLLLQGVQRRQGALSDDAREALQTALTAVDSAHRTVREYMEALRSPVIPNGSLESQLDALAQELRVAMGVRVDLRVAPAVDDLLPPAAVSEVLQIAREAAANAIRHGRASELGIRARRARDQIVLVIQDDGVGFDGPAVRLQPGHGLANMTQRARRLGGHLRITSAPGRGTEIRCELPLPARRHAGAPGSVR